MCHRINTETCCNPDRVHRLLNLTTDVHTCFTLPKEIDGSGLNIVR